MEQKSPTDIARKRNILILAAIFLVALLVLSAVVGFFGGTMDSPSADEALIEQYYEKNKDYFKTPDFSLTAEDDADYMQNYDRRIYYTDGPVRTELLPTDDLPTPALLPLVRMISVITAGDGTAYNALFSASYIAEKGEQAAFTAQKPYGIEITYVGASDNTYLFKLDYRLKDNDGTLRRDVVSDMSRTMNVTVVEEGGEYRITAIVYHFASR